MNIGDLSKKVGLPAKTIRFYEEIGLISEAARKENGYRNYLDSNIDELKIIKYARELGLPIQKIKKLMLGCKDGDCAHSKEYLLEEINEYLEIVRQKEIQTFILKTKLNLLKKSLENNNNKKSKYCCNILGQLIEDKERPPARRASGPKGGDYK